MKPPVEEVARKYFDEFGVQVDIQYGGSGTLLSNLRVAQQGDLYIAADESYINQGIEYGLIGQTQPLAFIKPVVAVLKGNPKNITEFEDLLNDELELAIGNPDAASIGRVTQKILLQTDYWKLVNSKVKVQMPTVNEVANSIKLKAVDAGIVWDATAFQYPDLEILETPMFDNYSETITIGVLKYSQNPEEAQKFIKYLSSIDKGLPVFEKMGYRPFEGKQR